MAKGEMYATMNLVMNDATGSAVDRLWPIAEQAGLSILVTDEEYGRQPAIAS